VRTAQRGSDSEEPAQFLAAAAPGHHVIHWLTGRGRRAEPREEPGRPEATPVQCRSLIPVNAASSCVTAIQLGRLRIASGSDFKKLLQQCAQNHTGGTCWYSPSIPIDKADAHGTALLTARHYSRHRMCDAHPLMRLPGVSVLAYAHAVPNCIALRSHAARTVRGVSTTLDHRWFHEQPICEQLRALCHPSLSAHRQHERYTALPLCAACLLACTSSRNVK
jgi:hypothetical protein